MKHLDKDRILFLDNHLFVVNKWAGILTQPNYGMKENMQHYAMEYLKSTFHKKKVFLHAIHRLDKQVSGIVIFARTSKALSRMQNEIRNKNIKKIYYGIVHGIINPKEAELIHFLKHGSHKSLLVDKHDKDAKEAHLNYKVIEEKNNYSYLEIHLHTGRYHQIRSQLSFIGHPIVGDKKYGSEFDFDKIFLHHGKSEFIHPVSKELISIECKPDFSIDDLN